MTDAERAREIAVRVTGLPLSEMADEIEAALAAARAEEREAAARIAESLAGLPETYHAPVFRHMIAAAIRAGGATSTATPG